MSYTMFNVFDAAFGLRAKSEATPTPTYTVKVPSAAGTISAVPMGELKAKLFSVAATPFPFTVTSPDTNPVEPSLKVNFTGMGDILVSGVNPCLRSGSGCQRKRGFFNHQECLFRRRLVRESVFYLWALHI
jgi:hypothetical protein